MRGQSNDAARRAAEGGTLASCEGFEVVSPDGRIGTVEEIRYEGSRRWDSPTELAVHAGRGGRMRLIVPVEDVAAIEPENRLVVLRSSPRILSTERANA